MRNFARQKFALQQCCYNTVSSDINLTASIIIHALNIAITTMTMIMNRSWMEKARAGAAVLIGLVCTRNCNSQKSAGSDNKIEKRINYALFLYHTKIFYMFRFSLSRSSQLSRELYIQEKSLQINFYYVRRRHLIYSRVGTATLRPSTCELAIPGS